MEKDNKNGLRAIDFYHIGHVLKFIKSSNKGQNKAVIETWDHNIITCNVGDVSLEEGAFVIIKFDGIIQQNGILMHPNVVSDVLPKDKGEQIWEIYQDFFNKTKPSHPLTG
mgnify:CR=1 FL=1